ncbi:toll-like receptor 3 [Lingula anatina]|uniref:Toll-like receptor 3 n=1 Tax=Lingula anatina TaxID=7574 RepID=A0A1S3I5E0_LINAN|nr:toll-like receptor 3 [Lingula anatina]|eukprot:XP_013392579.1 toll-like receptor 3 [Lingula anatina]
MLQFSMNSLSLCGVLVTAVLFNLSSGNQICEVVSTADGQYARCQRRGLTSPPGDLPNDISTLDLSDNTITSLGRRDMPFAKTDIDPPVDFSTQKYTNLRRLILANNRLSYISPTAFRGLQSLEVLDLSGNNLTSLPDVFTNLTSLRAVYLNNSPHMVRADFRVFTTLRNLEHLSLTGSKIKTIDIKFHIGLKETRLRLLNLTNNGISYIQAYAFKEIETLETVILDQNALSESEIALSLYGLRDSQIKSLSLRNFHDKLTYLTPSTFCNLQSTQIKNLSVAHNFVKSLRAGVFTCVSTLEHLDLSFSFYLESINDRTFHGLRSLKSLNLRAARLREIPTALGRLRSLEYLDLSNNLIHDLSPSSALRYLRKLKTLLLNENDLKYLTKDSFHGLQSLEFLDCGYNSLASIEDGSFKDLHNLKSLILPEVYVDSLTKEMIQGLENLTVLDLQSSTIRSLSDDVFTETKNLKSINFAGNQLQLISSTFRNLAHLKALRLQNNKIEYFDDHAFSGTDNLTILNLGVNKLKTFPQAIVNSKIQGLQHLNISHNLIATIGGVALDKLHRLRTFDARGNPFECNCDLASFVFWLNSSSAEGKDELWPSPAEYACSSPAPLKGSQIFLQDYSDCQIYPYPDGSKGASTITIPVWAIVVVLLGACACVSVAAFFIIRRNRRLKRNISHRLEDESREAIPVKVHILSKFQEVEERLRSRRHSYRITTAPQRCCHATKTLFYSMCAWRVKQSTISGADKETNEEKEAVFTTDSSGDMLLPINTREGADVGHQNGAFVTASPDTKNDASTTCGSAIYDDIIPMHFTATSPHRM